jgi:hypothetical protein
MARYDLYRKYFKHQCENHPDLAHADTNGSKVFQTIDVEEALGDFRTGAKEKSFIFRLINYTFQVGDDGADETKKIFTGGFIVARYFDQRNTGESDFYTAVESSEKIVDELIEKMVSDSRAGHPLFYHTLDARQNINVQPALQFAPGYAGWLVTFTFSNPIRICLTDEAAPAWSDGGQTPFEL